MQRQKPFYLVANGLDYIVTAVNYGREMFMRLATARKSSIVDFQKKKSGRNFKRFSQREKPTERVGRKKFAKQIEILFFIYLNEAEVMTPAGNDI